VDLVGDTGFALWFEFPLLQPATAKAAAKVEIITRCFMMLPFLIWF
jgi:hypothetical protein